MIGPFKLNRDARWIGFFGLILVSWTLLLAMSSAHHGALSGLAQLLSANPTNPGFAALWGMWALMAMAMMAPTFVPALKTYDDLTHTEAANRAGYFNLVAGYLLIWFGYALLGAAAQRQLAEAGLLSDGASTSPWLSAALLAAAGSYQFSKLKQACLSQCRAPMAFYIENWRDGATGALYMGLKLGALCAGCCWALMLLAFVGGTMNLVWMGVATILMTLEKLPRLSRVLTRPLGWTLLVAAALTAGRTLA